MYIIHNVCQFAPDALDSHAVTMWDILKMQVLGLYFSAIFTLLIPCRKCDKEKKDNDSMSPLLLLAVWGKAKAVQALVASGCDVNTTDKEGKSAVFWAAQEGHVDVLRVRLSVADCFVSF